MDKDNAIILSFCIVMAFLCGLAVGIRDGLYEGQKEAKDGIWRYHYVTNTVSTVEFKKIPPSN